MGGFDQVYRESSEFFGAEPDPLVRDYRTEFPPRRRVLDVGAGQGSNALWLARAGLSVDAIDPAQVAVDSISAVAADEGLDVTALCSTFDEHEPPPEGYGAVLVMGLLQVLRREAIDLLVGCLSQWTQEDSVVLATAFTSSDPGYARHRATWQQIGDGSFSNGDQVRTYLALGELRHLFDDTLFREMHYREYEGPEHRHADGPSHHHALVEGVFVRRPAHLSNQ